MKVLLLLNGQEGWQTGIEDGFSSLMNSGEISDLRWIYFDSIAKISGPASALRQIKEVAADFQPSLIVFFHIGVFPINRKFIDDLKKLPSHPILAYDEGDMYGTWAKPITASMRMIMELSDVVSIRGLGKFRDDVNKLNKNIIYTPHHADIARFDKKPHVLERRDNNIILIGNRVKPRVLSSLRRLPGARGRERLVQDVGDEFKEDFHLYGNGWDGFQGNRGPVPFQDQLEFYRNSWVTVAYEHYPKIPYYFSNRLPIALMAGSLYVCHQHGGYNNIFQGKDFIFTFKSNREAIDIIKYLFSLGREDLLERSRRAREFSLSKFHPDVVWGEFYRAVVKVGGYGKDN